MSDIMALNHQIDISFSVHAATNVKDWMNYCFSAINRQLIWWTEKLLKNFQLYFIGPLCVHLILKYQYAIYFLNFVQTLLRISPMTILAAVVIIF